MLGRKKQSVARQETAESASPSTSSHPDSTPSRSNTHEFPASTSAVTMPVPSRKLDRHHAVGSPPNVSSSVGSEKSSGGGWFPRKGWFGGGASSTKDKAPSSGAVDSSGPSRNGQRTISNPPGRTPFPTSQSVQANLSSTATSSSPLSNAYPRPTFTQHPSTSSTSIASNNLAQPSRGWFRRPTTLSSPTPPPAHLLAGDSEPPPPVPPLPQSISPSTSASRSATLPMVSPTLGLPVGPRRGSATSGSISPTAGRLAAGSPGEVDQSIGTVPTGGGGGSGALSGLGKKSWSRSMDDLSRLLTGGGEKTKTDTKTRIDDYKRQRYASADDAEDTAESPVSPTTTMSPEVFKPRPVAYGIEDELSSHDDHSGLDDPLSPFSEHADLPPTEPHQSSPPTSTLPPSTSAQPPRMARPNGRGPSPHLPGSGSTPGFSAAQHSTSDQSLASWLNGSASASTKATVGATKRALHAGGGLAGKVVSKPVEMFGHGRSMSGGLLGKGKEREKLKPVRSARDRLGPLEPGPSQFASTSERSGPATAPPGSAAFARGSLFPPNAAASSSSSSTPPATTLAANPHRQSQMVLHSGLVLRHMPPAPSSGPFRSAATGPEDLSKGWKPFKIVLRGSKLEFYKAPSDKRAEIESRFPARIVHSLQVPSVPRRQRTDESIQTVGSTGGATGRKARVFWGVGRHPDLDLFPSTDDAPPTTLSRDKIRSATPEALVHELVFASQMPVQEGRVEDIRLVDAVMFACTDFTAPSRFVTELERAVKRATASSLDQDDKEALMSHVRIRVQGIVERFCSGFGGRWWSRPADETALVKDMLKQVIESAFERNDRHRASLCRLVSHAGEQQGETEPRDWSVKDPSAAFRPELQGLSRTGLSLELFVSLDPSELARSVHVFHSDLFSSLFVGRSSAKFMSPSVFVDAAEAFPYAAGRPPAIASFSFSPDRAHFLTRLVMDHVLVLAPALLAPGPTPKPTRPPDQPKTVLDSLKEMSGTQLRGHVLSRWITVGEYLRLSGDAAGFMAVAMAVCSRPLARLTQTWRRMSEIDQTIVRGSWVPLLSAASYQDQEGQHIRPLVVAPQDPHKQERERIPPVPYLGTVVEDIRRARRADHPSLLSPDLAAGKVPLLPIWEAWEPVKQAMDAASSFASPKEQSGPDGVVCELVAYLQTLATSPTKPAKTYSFLKASLAAEARLLGDAEEAHARLGSNRSFGGTSIMIPLLFVQPLPTISLIDRDALLQLSRESQMGGKTGSYANLAAISKGAQPPGLANGVSQTAIVGLNAGGGRRPVRPRSLSAAHARTESLDLAQPTLPAGPSLPTLAPLSELSSGRKVFFGSLQAVGGLGETVLRLCGGDLLLKVNQDVLQRAGARPSRPTSIIETSSHSRRSSIIGGISARDSLTLTSLSSSFKRNSNPTGSRRDSILQGSTASKRISLAGSVSSDGLGPLRVEIKAGSLDNLLDVLLFGVDGLKMTVKDDMGVESGSSRRLLVDLQAYRTEFFATFRSFTTPSLVFEHIKQRYHSCLSAVEALNNPLLAAVDVFPAWTLADMSMASSSIDWSLVANLRLAVLSTLEHWMTQGAQQDILDSHGLHSSFTAFLYDIASPDQQQGDTRSNHKVQGAIAVLSSTLSSSILRPQILKLAPAPATLAAPTGAESTRTETAVPITTHLERTTPLGLVRDLDSLASWLLSRITEEDLFMTADRFEVQCCEVTGWLPVYRPSKEPSDDDVVISDFHDALNVPTAVPGSSAPLPIARRLAMSVRYAIGAQGTMRSWLVNQIADPEIKPRQRQARLEIMLAALDICRSRSADPDTTWTPSAPSSSSTGASAEPRIATFVGSAIRSALLSPESRMFLHSWYDIGRVRDLKVVDGLAQILSNDPAKPPVDCTVDLGWFLERLVEVVCMVPDHVDSAVSLPGLVNFDKRRYVFNLIGNVSGLISTRPQQGRDEAARLRLMEQETVMRPDLPTLLAHLKKERGELTKQHPHHRHMTDKWRPFVPLVKAQLDKHNRDKALRDRLGKLDRRTGLTGIDPMGRPLSTSASSQAKKKAGRGFLRSFRPLSMGHSHSSQPHTLATDMSRADSFESGRSLDDVDFATVGKPAMSSSIVDLEVTTVANCPRSFVFELRADQGAKIMLQASSSTAAEYWIDTLKKASRTYSDRRRTVLDGTPLEGLNETYELHLAGRQASRHPSSVYGIDLIEILRRESASLDSVPRVVERLLSEIELRGLDVEGIYRVPGAISQINSLQHALDRDWSFSLDDVDVHVLCGAFTRWFRSLPEPVIPFKSYSQFISAGRIPNENFEARLNWMQALVRGLPRERFVLLRRICDHLDKVTSFEAENRMNVNSLGTVFAPGMLKPPPSGNENHDYGALMGNLGPAQTIVRNLISEYHVLFSEPDDAEPEVEAASLGGPSEGGPTHSSSSILEEEGETLVEEADEEEKASSAPVLAHQ